MSILAWGPLHGAVVPPLLGEQQGAQLNELLTGQQDQVCAALGSKGLQPAQHETARSASDVSTPLTGMVGKLSTQAGRGGSIN